MPLHYHRIIIPVSGGPEDDRAIELVGELAQRHPTSITLVYVVEVLQAMPLDAELPEAVARGEAVLARAGARIMMRPRGLRKWVPRRPSRAGVRTPEPRKTGPRMAGKPAWYPSA